MPHTTILDTATVLRRIASGAGCLLWTADVYDRGGEHLVWATQMSDEEAAQRLFPVERQAGQSYAKASYLARLPEDQIASDRVGDIHVRAGESYHHQYRCRRADGELRWLQEDVQVETVAPGHWRAVGVCTDTTERKRAEEALQQAQEDLRSVLSRAKCLIWHADIEDRGGEYLHWTSRLVDPESAQAFFPVEVPPGESYLNAWMRHRLPEHLLPKARKFDLAIRSGNDYSDEFCCRALDGSLRWIKEDVRVETVAPGQWRAVGVCTDVTERRTASQRQERTLSSLQAVLSIVDELLACPDLDTVLRRAVELARERLGVERCAIFLSEGGSARGTFGTGSAGQTTDERALRIPAGEIWSHYFRVRTPDNPRWEVTEAEHLALEAEKVVAVGAGWVVNTPILQSGGRPIGVFFNDTAGTGAPLDPDQQDLIAVYCSLLGNLIARRQAVEALEMLQQQGNSLLWNAIVSEDPGLASGYRWEVHPIDQEAAQRILPLGLRPGESYLDASHRAKLPADQVRGRGLYTTALGSGTGSYSWEFRAVDAAGQVRSFLEQVSVQPIGAGMWRLVGLTTNVTEARRAEAELERRERQLELALKAGRMHVWEVDLRTNVLQFAGDLTPYAAEGTPAPATHEEFIRRVHPEDREKVSDATAEAFGPAGEFENEFRVLRPDGEVRWLLGKGSAETDEAGEPVRLSGIGLDITERRQLEEQFRQSQKMEAVGRLAGGVAHDFNNLLAVINGYADLLQMKLSEGHPMLGPLREIAKAGERAAGLTRQLLALSRKQMLEPCVVELNDLVLDIDKMLRRLIGEDIELVTLLDPGAGRVWADRGQFNQVLLNLSVNARDAMPQGGRLVIRTGAVERDGSFPGAPNEMSPGPYAVLEVTDTGCGMDEETLARAFEPFFTTKVLGQGTGLGLATVFGIVKQSGGHIEVESEPGAGATFRIFLPQSKSPALRAEPGAALTALPEGSGTILLCEDEKMVRELVTTVLEQCGYEVLAANEPQEAMRLAVEHVGEIDLLLTDVVMPGMSGPQLAERLGALRPDLTVLFMSGYTDDAVLRHGIEAAETQFLHKPFSPLTLARKVRELIRARSAGPVPPRLLLVDDNPAACESLAELLQDRGYLVKTATDGEKALEQMKQERFDLVLLDLMMPRMNGWVFRLEQEKDPAIAGVPVMVLSASPEAEAAARYLRAVDCLPKPLDVEELLVRVAEHSAAGVPRDAGRV
jgi:signal transduction histidine kinase/DNA-binding response OmpR family regulator